MVARELVPVAAQLVGLGSQSPASKATAFHSLHGGRKAYLDFELKDRWPPKAARLWRVLDFKIQIGSGRPSMNDIFRASARASYSSPRGSRRSAPYPRGMRGPQDGAKPRLPSRRRGCYRHELRFHT
jgi:hypothetical protein